MTDIKHVAIICDGNRRWARSKGLAVFAGHKKAVEETFETLIERAQQLEIPYLTFWIFSTENWSRDKKEVGFLMDLFRQIFDKQIASWNERNIRFKMIGDPTAFAEDIQTRIKEGMEKTKNNTGLTVTLAMNYGGRDELVRATKSIAQKVKLGELDPQEITKEVVSDHLDTAGMPDPDIIVRTSGEYRLSGFLSWQQQYSEFIFVPWNFPEFTSEKLDEVIAEFRNRTRRFGGG